MSGQTIFKALAIGLFLTLFAGCAAIEDRPTRAGQFSSFDREQIYLADQRATFNTNK